MSDLAEVFEAQRSSALAAQRAESRAIEQRIEFENQRATRDLAAMQECLRPATAADYSRWLTGYLRRGGRVTHFYDYPTPKMWVATPGLQMHPLCGSWSVDIIVPSGVTIDVQGLGHNNIFYMADFTAAKGHFVPAYSDTVITPEADQ